MSAPTYRRYVAIGDSFTEGLCDADDPPGGSGAGPAGEPAYRGWADRLAQALALDARAAGHDLEYANLAVRGRLLRGILADQLPVALASGADLVSLAGGGNDVLRPRADLDALAAGVDDAVAALRATGADVLLATGFDPAGLALVGRVRSRAAAYNELLREVARRRGAHVLDLWTLRALTDRRMWAPDRIHLSGEGHRRVALLAAHALRGGSEDAAEPSREVAWEAPLAAPPTRTRLAAARSDAAWAREHLLPWVGRRLTGRSSGDGRSAKLPVPAVVAPAAHPGGDPSPTTGTPAR